MSMVRNFRNSDEGKKVMTADGEMIGTVERIRGDEAHVRPDTGLSQSVRETLGWTDESEEMYPLRHESVEQIAGDEIHLKSTF